MNNNRRPMVRGGGTRVRRERYDDRPDPYLQDSEIARNRPAGNGLTWKKLDLHLHTPASSDYRDPGVTYLDILKKAEEKGLDMIAFADHNTVSGYAAMHQEIETLSLLERLNRISDDEQATLNEYRRLLQKIVVLPAFEFTATFGFHILGIFPEGTSVRKLEYLLLNLNVPEEKMVRGAPDVGSSDDVLTAYAAIAGAGGMAIAAHANSSNGVAMQGFPFGGQTKIAYTQDPNLVALEVTDLEVTGRRSTAGFYNGTKTEYPRRMHCIQGSDAHSLETEQSDANNKRLGVGARITEVLMREASFAALKEVLTGDDFTRIRPYRSNPAWERIEAARVKGPNQIVAFHERALHVHNRTRPIMQDVVAFANGYGGIIYIGVSPDTKVPVQGVDRPEEVIRLLREDVQRMVEPRLDVNFDVKPGSMSDQAIVVMNVPGGDNRPYVFAPTSQIYIRQGGESLLATRSEMIRLVVDAEKARGAFATMGAASATTHEPITTPAATAAPVPTIPEARPILPAGEAISSTDDAPSARQAQERRQDRPDRQRQERAEREPQQPPREERKSWRERSEERRAQRDAAETPAAEVEVPEQAPAPAAPPLREERRAAAQPSVAGPTSAPEPAPNRPSVRIPSLHELPPEKIKGQVQPMARTAGAPAPPPASVEPPQSAVHAVEAPDAQEVAPEIEQAIIEAVSSDGMPDLPEDTTPVIDGTERLEVGYEPAAPARGTRSRRKPGSAIPEQVAREMPAATVNEAVQAAEPEAPAPQAEQPEEAAQPARPRRGRGRRKGEEVAVERNEEVTAEAATAEPPVEMQLAAPMEAGVAAEHLSREDIVQAEAEQPRRGRGRSRKARSAEAEQLEVGAPTAAAAATEAGQAGILVQAETQPGPQIPAELPEDTPAEAPAKKGRSRRKSAAVQAAAADAGVDLAEGGAQEPAPAEATPAPEPEVAPTETRSRRGRRKKGEEAVAEAAPVADMVADEPPAPPATGVEIIDSVAGERSTSHTMRDLRNGQTVRNVTKQSARRLWHYAITQNERGNPALSEVLWHDTLPIGVWRRDERAGAVRFDLVSRYPDGSMRIFYGVTDEGLSEHWREVVQKAEAAGWTGPEVE
ncbi:MAG: putative DNA binding domain-containing protein [Chloroflexota bacterium]|nr:putative DNA binding domain-containing protein [Chloroflexota bacterium]MDQ5867455.1 putative DNA binding domain-containing protein [Chloroflexota bacterium]